jgi:MoxR-like ATPase
MTVEATPALDAGRRLQEQVLAPMKAAFVGKDEVIDLLGVGLIGGENVFVLGPPGTAKSALVQDLGRRLNGRVFDYLLTRFTEPNELFGPFDIRRLRDGDLVTNTEGMLPEAEFVFLDELLNANSAILNSLLMVLNERIFRRGREMRALPTLMVVGASNRLPEDEALGALFDRFLLRVRCDNVPAERLSDVLHAGWALEMRVAPETTSIGVDEVRSLQRLLREVDLTAVRGPYLELIRRLRYAGIRISDRRAVKLQRPIAASALLCGRMKAATTDLWVLRYVWDTEEQQEVIASIVQDAIERAGAAGGEGPAHPRSRPGDVPDPEGLARDLDRIDERLKSGELSPADQAFLRDQVAQLSARCQWVAEGTQRDFLSQRVASLWPALGGKP